MPDGGIQVLDLDEKWPSDDSEDADYDPEKMTNTGISCAGSDDSQSYDSSSSTSLSWSLDGEILSGPTISGKGGFSYPEGIAGSDLLMDADTVCGPRQRNAVDYKQLYNVSICFSKLYDGLKFNIFIFGSLVNESFCVGLEDNFAVTILAHYSTDL